MPRPKKTQETKKKDSDAKEVTAPSKDLRAELKIEKKKPIYNFKLFDRWDLSEVEVSDISLAPYINLSPMLVPKSLGKNIKRQFWKSKKQIVERLMTKMMVAGHKGKKHWRTTGANTGKYSTLYNTIIATFTQIENKTKKNPVQVFVDALCNASPKEGIATIEYGGVRYPKAVDLSPQRRIDLVLRWMTQGAYASSASGKTKMTIHDALANEIILASQADAKSTCLRKTVELERQSSASR